MNPHVLSIGMIGAGRFARTLTTVASQNPRMRVVAACDALPERAAALAHDFDLQACSTVSELVARADVDAVIISTSHDMHVHNTLEAARAGKHVFCEKPMALTAAECRAMIETVTQHNVRLLIGQVTRLLPMMRRIRQILDSGIIGRPVAMHMLRTAWVERLGWWAKTATSGGMLHSHGAHMYDLINSFLGQPVSLYAVAAPRIQPQIDYDDTIFSTVTYASGAVASVGASVSGQTWVYRGGIIADAGSLQFELAVEACSLVVQPRGAAPIHELFGTFDQEGVDGVVVELENFAAMILDDAPPFVTSAEAMQAVAMLQAAYESVRTGRVIRLDEWDAP